ncbi:uncharacterized protein LOC112562640 isoform X1 [Pomacea canaliculata]|uniref:uncharacterized protein LOC112562640 isoform X1 n=2 Tax=Pomacea canaliculata TaxID=400727 RepID=UPI000D736DE3|nr:uncharacterized protein LOC112562640 isoform X1 [Pomacea canaliculata]XP_025091796.1 uncharacterized protein LOC112562640 isoform X1 [Pomacea canaliculata]
MASVRNQRRSRRMDCTVASLTLSGGRVQGCLLLVLIVVLWPSSVEPKKLFVDGIDTSLLQLKEVLHLVMEDGKLYNDSPNFTWIIKNSSCHKPPRDEAIEKYCPSVAELTVDFNRQPVFILQTRCNECGPHCKDRNPRRNSTTGLCRAHSQYRRVKIKGRGVMFQKFKLGCYCDYTKHNYNN